MHTGTVVAIHVRSGSREPMQSLQQAVAISNMGLQGDHKAKSDSLRQVLVMDKETLDSLDLVPGIIRENITLQGIPVASLQPEQIIFVGDEVTLEVTGPCEPCYRMDEIREGLRDILQGCRGTLAVVLNGGTFQTGDNVKVEP